MYRNVQYSSHVNDECMTVYIFAVETWLTICMYTVHFPCEQRRALMTCAN